MFHSEDTGRSNENSASRPGVRWLPRTSAGRRGRAIARWEDEGGRIASNDTNPVEMDLSQQKLRRLKALIVRLKALETAVDIEFQSPRPDDDHLQRLKRARLRVKDEIFALREA